MVLKLWLLFVFISSANCFGIIRIGLIQKKGEEITEELFQRVIQKDALTVTGRSFISFQTVTAILPEEDAWYFHRAVCQLLEQKVHVIVTPVSAATFPIIASYSNEYRFPFLSPSLPETPDDPTAPDLIAQHGFGIKPSTTRASLDLFRYFGWQNIVYIYDDDFGPEKLQIMFRVAYSVLKLHLAGFLKATSPEDAVQYLRKLDQSLQHKTMPVILDTDSSLAAEILLRVVHDAGIRKDKFHFLLIQLTLEDFWISHEAQFRIITLTGFLTVKPDFQRFNKIDEEWRKLFSFGGPFPNASLKLSHYFYHDAALVLSKAMKKLPFVAPSYVKLQETDFQGCFRKADADHNPGYSDYLKNLLKTTVVTDGMTGHIEFDRWNGTQSKRKDFNLTIIQSSPTGYHEFGTWSIAKHGLRLFEKPISDQPEALPITGNKLRILAKLSPPYWMYKNEENASDLQGNDRYEGFCKDLMDNLCEYLHVECEVKLVEDGTYGRYDRAKGRWSGIVGDLIQGKAEIAIADLIITGERQRVIDFTDPFEMVSPSLVLKNPDVVDSTSSSFFIFVAFSSTIWICILVSFVLFCVLFHGITKFTGAPDSIESASGIWGRKNNIVANLWFSIGSSLIQGTGIYPRSISSRILSGGWWFFTSIMTCFFIASLIFQLQLHGVPEEKSTSLMQLKSLSLESILSESLENGWPKVGIENLSNTFRFMKKSTLPLFRSYTEFFTNNPSVVASDKEEGIRRVRQSKGGYAFLMESSRSEYEIRQKPCDLVEVRDPYVYASYGIATPFKYPLRFKINEALSRLNEKGLISHLHRKWWIESSQCNEEMKASIPQGSLQAFSGLFYFLLIGCCILTCIFVIQYFRKIQHKEDRLQQLTFDDRTLEHHLPDPPPELLEEPPPILNPPEIEKRDFCDSESFSNFFERMRAGR